MRRVQHILDFRPCFALSVATLSKRQTVRKERKRPIQCGDTLLLYTGLRTPACQKLGEEVCVGVDDILIEEDSITMGSIRATQPEQLRYFAQLDGFGNWEELLAFFRGYYGELPFRGKIIFW